MAVAAAKRAAAALEVSEQVVEIPLGQLFTNPLEEILRGPITDESCVGLAESVLERGIIEPLIVTPKPEGEGFYITAGHRRKKGAVLAGLETAPCIIRHQEQEAQLLDMLVENIQRAELLPSREARTFQYMIEHQGKTRKDIERQTGCPTSYVSARLQLLQLPEEVQQLADEGRIPLSIVPNLQRIEDEPKLREIALRAAQRQLTTTQINALISIELETSRKNVRRRKDASNRILKRSRALKTNTSFTRSSALEALGELGKKQKESVPVVGYELLALAFDDVCQDACLEKTSPEFCHACPVPRFVMSILTRLERQKNASAA